MIKRITRSLRELALQMIYRMRHSRNNRIGNGVRFNKDTDIGKNCVISEGVCFGKHVKLGDNVKVGKRAFLARITIDDNSVIEGKVIITGTGKGLINIGRNSFIGHNTVLDHSDNITIGNYVHVGYNQFWTHSSARQCFAGVPLENKDEVFRPTAPILIEDNVYVGVQSIVYPGITIGHHSVIMPNTVVNKNVEPHSLIGGIPGKKIKQIDKIGDL